MLSYMADKSCALCGESDMRVLEFDHLDPLGKKFSISQSVKLNYGIEDILTELKNAAYFAQTVTKSIRHSRWDGIKQYKMEAPAGNAPAYVLLQSTA